MATNQATTPVTDNQLNELQAKRKEKGLMHIKKHILAEAVAALYKKEMNNFK